MAKRTHRPMPLPQFCQLYSMPQFRVVAHHYRLSASHESCGQSYSNFFQELGKEIAGILHAILNPSLAKDAPEPAGGTT